MNWNYGDIFDAVLPEMPAEGTAIVEPGDGRRRSWDELRRRSDNLARAFLEAGLRPGDKAAIYMHNRIEYLETILAIVKARLVHVNVNYRYLADELHYVLDNSDAAVVVFDAPRARLVQSIRDRLGKVKMLVEVPDEDGGIPVGQPFESLAGKGAGTPLALERSGDDLWFLYTGGTTGRPKAVMSRQDVLFRSVGQYGLLKVYPQPPADLAEQVARAREHLAVDARSLICAPLMHAVGLYNAIFGLSYGVSLVLMRGERFDAEACLDAVAKYRVTTLSIVGEAMGGPLAETLRNHPGRWDLSCLGAITSSGMALGMRTKRSLLESLPQLTLYDRLGSSESPGMGMAVYTRDTIGSLPEGKMNLRVGCRVFAEDLAREVVPGSGERGLFARTGLLPEGYYKDPAGTAKTFPVIDGERYVITGDWAEVLADGMVRFLGRGATCINSGGEKVHAEEVEAAIRQHPDVADVAVVGLPDSRWGEAVIAVVQLYSGRSCDAEGIQVTVRGLLAGYKVPKKVVFVAEVRRLASGKTDYPGNRRLAAEATGIEP